MYLTPTTQIQVMRPAVFVTAHTYAARVYWDSLSGCASYVIRLQYVRY